MIIGTWRCLNLVETLPLEPLAESRTSEQTEQNCPCPWPEAGANTSSDDNNKSLEDKALTGTVSDLIVVSFRVDRSLVESATCFNLGTLQVGSSLTHA